MSISKKMYLWSLWFISTALFLLTTIFIYKNYIDSQTRILMYEEESHVRVITEINQNTIKTLVSDLLIQSSHAHLIKAINENNQIDIELLAGEFAKFIDNTEQYDQIRLIDISGQEKIRVNSVNGKSSITPDELLQNKSDRYYVQRILSLSPGEIYLSPFDLNVENGEIEKPYKPMIRVGTPIFSESGKPEGFIILNFLGEKILDYFGLSMDEEISIPMFINKEGYWLKGQNESDEWGFMFENRKDVSFSRAYPEEWKRISTTDSGQLTTDSGIFTFETIRPAEAVEQAGFSIVDNMTINSKRFWKVISFLPREKIQEKFIKTKLLLLSIIITGLFLITLIHSMLIINSTRKKKMDIERESLINELSEALKNIKTLSGLVPICAHCKSIRDDKGYWKEIEEYVEQHTEAEFSHALCPTCAEELYGNEPWYKKSREKG